MDLAQRLTALEAENAHLHKVNSEMTEQALAMAAIIGDLRAQCAKLCMRLNVTEQVAREADKIFHPYILAHYEWMNEKRRWFTEDNKERLDAQLQMGIEDTTKQQSLQGYQEGTDYEKMPPLTQAPQPGVYKMADVRPFTRNNRKPEIVQYPLPEVPTDGIEPKQPNDI